MVLSNRFLWLLYMLKPCQKDVSIFPIIFCFSINITEVTLKSAIPQIVSNFLYNHKYNASGQDFSQIKTAETFIKAVLVVNTRPISLKLQEVAQPVIKFVNL